MESKWQLKWEREKQQDFLRSLLASARRLTERGRMDDLCPSVSTASPSNGRKSAEADALEPEEFQVETIHLRGARELQWKHGGERRWSPRHPTACGNFRGLFPNPFK